MKQTTYWLTTSAFVRFLVMLSLAISTVDAVETDKMCVAGKSVTFSFSHRTNKTGDSIVNGRLQKEKGANWLLDVDLKTSFCDTANLEVNILSFELTDFGIGSSATRSPSDNVPVPRTSPKKQSPPGYTLREPFGYFRLGAEALPWEKARDACAKEGAHLAFATSEEEALMYTREFDFRVNGSSNSVWSWYGASDIAQEGTYVTVTGVLLKDTGYSSTKALSSTITRNCLFINQETPLLDDLECYISLAYACKI